MKSKSSKSFHIGFGEYYLPGETANAAALRGRILFLSAVSLFALK